MLDDENDLCTLAIHCGPSRGKCWCFIHGGGAWWCVSSVLIRNPLLPTPSAHHHHQHHHHEILWSKEKLPQSQIYRKVYILAPMQFLQWENEKTKKTYKRLKTKESAQGGEKISTNLLPNFSTSRISAQNRAKIKIFVEKSILISNAYNEQIFHSLFDVQNSSDIFDDIWCFTYPKEIPKNIWTTCESRLSMSCLWMVGSSLAGVRRIR